MGLDTPTAQVAADAEALGPETARALLGQLGLDPRVPPDAAAWEKVVEVVGDLARERDAALESAAEWRGVLELAVDAVILVDETHHVVWLNRAAEDMHGVDASDVVGAHMKVFLPEPLRSMSDAAASSVLLAGGSGPPPFRGEKMGMRADGTLFPVDVTISPIEVAGRSLHVAIVRDITDQRLLEAELRTAHKREAVGRLAAGIAHEINTPTQFVGDNLAFLEEVFPALLDLLGRLRDVRNAAEAGADTRGPIAAADEVHGAIDADYLDKEVPNALGDMREGIVRIAAIVGALKGFASPESSAETAADLNKALTDTLTVTRNQVKRLAEVECEFSKLPLVLCRLGDLNQAFLNIVLNAAQAIGDAGRKGRIQVRTRHELGAGYDDVVITVRDDGCGIRPEDVEHVFDPFFSTREAGSGQGLWFAKSVVEAHGGTIDVESDLGRGTTLTVRLPVDGNPAEERR